MKLNSHQIVGLKQFLDTYYHLPTDYFKKNEKKLATDSSALEELVRIYNEIPCKIIWTWENEDFTAKEFFRILLQRLGRNADLNDNIEEFIKGEPIGNGYNIHQWVLKVFYPETAAKIHPYIKDLYLNINSFDNFEQIFDKMTCDKREPDNEDIFRGFGPTCNYDVIFRMVYAYSGYDETHRLIPSAYVYLHSKPGRTAKLLMDNGQIKKAKNRILYDDIIDKNYPLGKSFRKYHMPSIDIENFLCINHDAIAILYNAE